MFFHASEGDEQGMEKMREFFSPTQIDRQIRQAIQFCWMALPKEKWNVAELERQIRRLVDRALRDCREDFDEFFGKKSPCLQIIPPPHPPSFAAAVRLDFVAGPAHRRCRRGRLDGLFWHCNIASGRKEPPCYAYHDPTWWSSSFTTRAVGLAHGRKWSNNDFPAPLRRR